MSHLFGLHPGRRITLPEHAGPGCRGAQDPRMPPGARRRPHRLEPGLDHQFLGAPARRRSKPMKPLGAAREIHAAEPLRHPSRPSRSTATSAARPASPRCCCKATPGRSSSAGVAQGLAGRPVSRPSGAWRGRGGSDLARRQTNARDASRLARRHPQHPAAARRAHFRCAVGPAQASPGRLPGRRAGAGGEERRELHALVLTSPAGFANHQPRGNPNRSVRSRVLGGHALQQQARRRLSQ